MLHDNALMGLHVTCTIGPQVPHGNFIPSLSTKVTRLQNMFFRQAKLVGFKTFLYGKSFLDIESLL